VLPHQFAAAPEWRQRLEREARDLVALAPAHLPTSTMSATTTAATSW
jgi:hypothetical protein